MLGLRRADEAPRRRSTEVADLLIDRHRHRTGADDRERRLGEARIGEPSLHELERPLRTLMCSDGRITVHRAPLNLHEYDFRRELLLLHRLTQRRKILIYVELRA